MSVGPELTAIVAVVTAFAQSATTRDVARLEDSLDPAAVQHVRMNGAWSALPTPVYLQLMRDQKIGGEPVDVEIHSVNRTDRVATVHATRLTPSLRFDDVLTVVDSGDNWKIVSAAVVVTPVAR